TQTLTVSVSNLSAQVCDESIALDAPEFGVSPDTLNPTLTIPPQQARSFVWILIPQKLGTFALAISFSSPEIAQTIGITVTNVLGLTIWQAQLLSDGGTLLGVFFGPLLAIVWMSRVSWRRKKARGKWTQHMLPKKRFLPANGGNPLSLIYCFTHEDKALRDRLEQHLSPLLRSGHISTWYDDEITPGKEWEDEIMAHLNAADIILLLISPDFVACDHCMSQQMTRAMERHHAGEATVVPILLRHVDWESLPFAKLRVLPLDRRPVSASDWTTEDEAFYDVVQGIRQVVGSLLAVKARSSQA
ncbi:MAG TPA: toll/interleukin-1 receptor domain-containing protein, partial [Ktedonobacteraceae bacterium]|nr:toll/interleukin-1 receptor domain-containing protein [Ktedonobacteraceae bacterium]